jgi:hypothetical protein
MQAYIADLLWIPEAMPELEIQPQALLLELLVMLMLKLWS